MNLGIDGMGGPQIGREHQELGIGTIGAAMTMMMMMMVMMTALGIEEGGQVTVRDREAESAGETRLAVRAAQNMIHHPRSDIKPIVIEALHHEGMLLETRVLTDRMMTQELHTGAEAEWIVPSDLVLPAVLLLFLPTRSGNLRDMHWTISVMSLCHHDRVQRP